MDAKFDFCLGGKKGPKDMLHVLRLNTNAGIFDRHGHSITFLLNANRDHPTVSNGTSSVPSVVQYP